MWSCAPDFVLLLEFENSERRAFDMAAYLDQKPWSRLKSGNTFQGAFVENGTVTWQGNVDIKDMKRIFQFWMRRS